MIGKIIGYLLFTALSLAVVSILTLYYIYSPLTEGTIYLKNAKGTAEVVREVETGIQHVYASSQQMALYTQGFLHARDRLWQMEKLRRVTQGRLGEIFGELAIQADKFARVIGFYRSAEETYQNLDAKDKDMLQEYCNGVNDFISNIHLTNQNSTAKLLPPEFYAVGIHKMEKWSPVDSLSILKLLNFHLSWNWSQDLTRDVIASYHKDIEEMIGEIAPFTSEFSYNLLTILDDDDLKQSGYWHDESLQDRYNKALGKPVKSQKAEVPKQQKPVEPVKEQKREEPKPPVREVKKQPEATVPPTKPQQEVKKDQQPTKAPVQVPQKEEQKEVQKEIKKDDTVKQQQKETPTQQPTKQQEAAKPFETKPKESQQAQTQPKVEQQAQQKEQKQSANERASQEQQPPKEERVAGQENKQAQPIKKEQEAEVKKIVDAPIEKVEPAKTQEDKDSAKQTKEQPSATPSIVTPTAKATVAPSVAIPQQAEPTKAKTDETKQEQPPKTKTSESKQEEPSKQDGPKINEHKKPESQDTHQAKPKLNEKEPPKAEDVVTLEGIDTHSYLDDQMASNNWVIHGNHTKTGRPLLASDPHLGTQLPTHWYLMELAFNGTSTIGTTHPGIPFVLIGKTEHFTWGITAVLADISDLYKEKINDDETQYYVDGQWKDLKVRKEQIYVKGKAEPYTYIIRFTHRGPILDVDSLTGSQVLFSGGLPIIKGRHHYSLAWGGHEPYEQVISIFSDFHSIKTIDDVFKRFDGAGTYYSIPQNLIFAFDNGDIGYYLGATAPIRKNKTPFTGCRVLDGTNTDNDWVGFVQGKDLPRVKNPKKGFVVTANNRVVPENVLSDIGATITSTARAQRITELIQSGIDKGQKFDYLDMIKIQQDQVDLIARDLIESIVRIIHSMLDKLSKEQRNDVEKVLPILEKWHGEMYEDSIGATIYSTWQLFFYDSLFHNLVSDPTSIMTIYNNYPFIDFYQRLVQGIRENPEDLKFNKICAKGYKEYKGDAQCAYNMARALSEAKQFLEKEVTTKIEDWEWRNVHVNEYAHQPFSMTPLKPLFHREVPVGGNGNTPCVSKYNFNKVKQLKSFKSTHTANYKQVIQFGKTPQEDKAFFSHDGGQHGNLFSGHYFDMNRRHLDGDLFPMLVGKSKVEQVSTETLEIKTEALRPKATIEDVEINLNHTKKNSKKSGTKDNAEF